MTRITSLIRQPNIRNVWEDFASKRSCGHFLFNFKKKKSVMSFHISHSIYLLLPEGTIYFTTTVHRHTHFNHKPQNLSTVSHDLYLIFPLLVFFHSIFFLLLTNNIPTSISPWIISSRSELPECAVKFKTMLIFVCGGKRCVWVLLQTDTFIYTPAPFHQHGLINN